MENKGKRTKKEEVLIKQKILAKGRKNKTPKETIDDLMQQAKNKSAMSRWLRPESHYRQDVDGGYTRITPHEMLANKLGAKADQIFNKMIDLALIEGDFKAISFFLERLIIPEKPERRLNSKVRNLFTLADYEAAARTLLEEVATGEVCIDKAKIFLDMLKIAADMRYEGVDIQLQEISGAISKGKIITQ